MGALINLSLNLDKLDKSKIVKGKKGNYYKFTVSVQDKTSQYGDNASAFDAQSKEEREAKAERNYIGNGSVVWTDGNIVAAERKQESAQEPTVQEADFPF